MKTLALFSALALVAGPAAAQDGGRAAYLTNCSACHQATGLGVKGAFPALAGDPFVKGPPAPVIALVLNGQRGMPGFKSGLTDAQAAAAITYIRSAWSNGAAAVTPPDVAAVRSGAHGAAASR